MHMRIAKLTTGTAAAIVALAMTGPMLTHAQTTYTNNDTGTSGSDSTLVPNTGTDGTNTTDSGTGDTGTTGAAGPGIPDTGAGASTAINVTLLGLAALAALGSVAYLSRQRFE
jgi:hypothetical protein